jgi:CubicO group peptidase (beta-lactamase class C family)
MRRTDRRQIWGVVIVALALWSCPVRSQGFVYPGVSWATATPASQGFDPVAFQVALNQLPSPSVVVRHGYLVGSKGRINRRQALWSTSKSLTALVAGRLLQTSQLTLDTLVPGSGSPLASYRQFLSMTSDYQLSPHQPGAHFAYNNNGVTKYGEAMRAAFFPGQSAATAVRSAYLAAIGIQDGISQWSSGWAGGFYLSARDLARVAYLVLRNGNWNVTQLLSVPFTVDLLTPQIPVTATISPDRSNWMTNEWPTYPEMQQCYSFGFWLPHLCPTWFGGPSQTMALAMWGANGTTVYIAPGFDLVIVTLGSLDETQPGTYPPYAVPASRLDQFVAAIVN